MTMLLREELLWLRCITGEDDRVRRCTERLHTVAMLCFKDLKAGRSEARVGPRHLKAINILGRLCSIRQDRTWRYVWNGSVFAFSLLDEWVVVAGGASAIQYPNVLLVRTAEKYRYSKACASKTSLLLAKTAGAGVDSVQISFLMPIAKFGITIRSKE